MEVIAQMIQLLNLVVGIMLIVAILRLFTISSTLSKILKRLDSIEQNGVFKISSSMTKVMTKLDTMDQNRRDEFNAMTEAQS